MWPWCDVSEGLPLPSGNFRTEDMVALGVSLALVLLICFVVIGILAYNITRFKSDWKKLSEASVFRSSVSRFGICICYLIYDHITL